MTLSNIAGAYAKVGNSAKALTIYEQALLLSRKVGNREAEIAILYGNARIYSSLRRYKEAEHMLIQSIRLSRQISNPTCEITSLIGLAVLLYSSLSRSQDAIELLEQAMVIFQQTGLPQDGAGQTPEVVQQLLQAMRQGILF